MTKLYNFRYPYDIQSTLEPWRTKLGGEFDTVVARLADRDRAIEDHLNFGLSQGRLAYATSTSTVSRTTTGFSDFTGLEVTVTVPENRVLRITGQADVSTVNNGSGGIAPTAAGHIYQNGVSLGYFAFLTMLITGGITGTAALEIISSGSLIVTPAAGTYTYKLVLQKVTADTGTVALIGSAASPAFILVEDLGPVNT